MKKAINLYLNLEAVAKLQKDKINISQYFNNILECKGNEYKALKLEIKRLTEELKEAREVKHKPGVHING